MIVYKSHSSKTPADAWSVLPKNQRKYLRSPESSALLISTVSPSASGNYWVTTPRTNEYMRWNAGEEISHLLFLIRVGLHENILTMSYRKIHFLSFYTSPHPAKLCHNFYKRLQRWVCTSPPCIQRITTSGKYESWNEGYYGIINHFNKSRSIPGKTRDS